MTDPFADRLVEGPIRTLYEDLRSQGYEPARALRFALGPRGTAFDAFADPRDAMAADLVLNEGAPLDEAGPRADRRLDTGPPRPSGTSGTSGTSPLREDASPEDRVAYWRQRHTEILAESLSSPAQVDDWSRRLKEAWDEWLAAARAVDERNRSTATSQRSTPPRQTRPPVRPLNEGPRTVADYQALGLSEADARAAARRNGGAR